MQDKIRGEKAKWGEERCLESRRPESNRQVDSTSNIKGGGKQNESKKLARKKGKGDETAC